MKKLLTLVISVVLSLSCIFAMTACGNKTSAKINVYKDILLTEETYAFAINKTNTTLKDTVDNILQGMIDDGSLDTLINSYFDGTATFTYENPKSKDGCFIVATNAYFPPFEYFEGSKFSGIDMQIAKIIADSLQKTLYIEDQEFDSLISSVKNNQADIAMAGMTVTDTRLEQVDFSLGYYKSAQVISVLDSCTLFDNCKTAAEVEAVLAAQSSSFIIGTQQGTTGYMYSKGDEDFGYDGFKNLTTNAYNTGALAMQDLKNGKISAVILDLQPSLMIQKAMNK